MYTVMELLNYLTRERGKTMKIEFIGKQMNNTKFESNEDGTYNLDFTTLCKTKLGEVICACAIEKLSIIDCANLIKGTNNSKITITIETEEPKKKSFWKR